VAGIHPKKIPDRFPIENVGNNKNDGFRFSVSAGMEICIWWMLGVYLKSAEYG